jgi:hypothetical protein
MSVIDMIICFFKDLTKLKQFYASMLTFIIMNINCFDDFVKIFDSLTKRKLGLKEKKYQGRKDRVAISKAPESACLLTPQEI